MAPRALACAPCARCLSAGGKGLSFPAWDSGQRVGFHTFLDLLSVLGEQKDSTCSGLAPLYLSSSFVSPRMQSTASEFHIV